MHVESFARCMHNTTSCDVSMLHGFLLSLIAPWRDFEHVTSLSYRVSSDGCKGPPSLLLCLQLVLPSWCVCVSLLRLGIPGAIPDQPAVSLSERPTNHTSTALIRQVANKHLVPNAACDLNDTSVAEVATILP